MNAFVQATTVLLPTAYLVAAVLYGMAFAGERQPTLAPRLRRPVLAVALLLHGLEAGLQFPVLAAHLLQPLEGLTDLLLEDVLLECLVICRLTGISP